MKDRLSLACLVCILFGELLIGCTQNVVGGNPIIPLANTNGTSQVLDFTLPQVEKALTNAFALGKYYGMPFLEVTNSDWDYLAPNWHPRNGYILYEGDPIARIPLDTGITVPYRATFYITLQSQLEIKKTKITIRTMQAEVIDGQEQGVHGGQASHSRIITPVRQEEQAVIEAILKQLKT
jgi:hypothetical protein